jgi:hypothetical protein
MELMDLEGRIFTINDIDGTIALVAEFLNYRTSGIFPSLQRLDGQRLRYWNDFYAKLLTLQSAMDKEYWTWLLLTLIITDMKHDISAVQAYGIILLVIGMAARYLVNRRRFNRRSRIQPYVNYEQSEARSFIEGLVKFIGLLMVLFGLYLIVIEYENHRVSNKDRTEQHHPKAAQNLS